jgi:acylphosphatase
MDQEQAIEKARQFADMAHSVAVEKLVHKTQEQLAALRNRLAAQGTILSGTTVVETARIRGEQVTAMLETRLNLLLEGFELHNVVIDDGVRDEIVEEMTKLRNTWTENALAAMKQDHIIANGPVQHVHFLPQLEQNIGLPPNEVRTRIERARLARKKAEANTSIKIYHVSGNNNRWLENSEDHSVNVVTQSSDQIFANLRQEIESQIPAGEQRTEILEKLFALEQAQNSPSFAQRYTEFIAAAASYVTIITPFIPALTEMLQKHIS